MTTEPNESYSNAEEHMLSIFNVSYSGSAKAFPEKAKCFATEVRRRLEGGCKKANPQSLDGKSIGVVNK